MKPDEILAAIHDDRNAGRETALVALAYVAAEYLAADADFRSVLDSDGVADHVFVRIVRRLSMAEKMLFRAVGYKQQDPIEEIDEDANKRIADALGHLGDEENAPDPDWQNKTWEVIDREQRQRNRWWRRFARWLRGK